MTTIPSRRQLLKTSLAIATGATARSIMPDSAHGRVPVKHGRCATRIDEIIGSINPLEFGISVAVYERARLIFAKGYGWRDRGRPDNFTGVDFFKVDQLDERLRLPRGEFRPDVDTIYNLGSVSKQFTAGAILLLNQWGRLSLSDRVTTYFPQYAAAADVSLLDLLHHESGIPDYNAFPEFDDAYAQFRASKESDYEPIVAKLATLPLQFGPGTQFRYSNSNYLLLALIIEQVAHTSYAEFLGRHIFGPLRMRNTKQGYPRAGRTNVALGYVADGDAPYRAYEWNLPWMQGAGGLTSTARDVGRWDWAVQHGGLFTRESRDVMFTPALGDYACGWVVTTHNGHRYRWHNGTVGGFHTMNAIFPDQGLAVILLSNNQALSPQLEYAAPQVFDAVNERGGPSR